MVPRGRIGFGRAHSEFSPQRSPSLGAKSSRPRSPASLSPGEYSLEHTRIRRKVYCMRIRSVSALLSQLQARIPTSSLLIRAMSSSSSTMDLPVIAVIGTTGVGKSKLSIELAQHIARRFSEQPQASSSSSSSSTWKSAEVINADSMQIYKGLDVITNKVTEEEMEGVNHRLLGVVDPRGEKGWGMAKWVEASLDEVSSTLLPFSQALFFEQ